MLRRLAVLALLLLGCRVALAQDGAAPLRFGDTVTGQINNQTTRQSYTFDGRRGEFISITLSPTGGDLDPLLAVLDADGTVIITQDDGNGRGVRLDALRIPRNGRYTLIVTRFGGPLGTTIGEFTLTLERVGVSSDSGSSLRYNDTILNTITDAVPALYYTFQAQRGDILDIRMQRTSGDLDPLLQVINRDAVVLAASDDIPGSSTLDAAVEGLVIDADGTYAIIATRYGEAAGDSTGSFILTLTETDESGLGNTLQTAQALVDGLPTEGELNNDRFERFYTFEARENDLVTVQMERVSGSLDAFVAILDENLREVGADDDGGGGQNAALTDFLIPADGLYYVKATRFGGPEGSTAGRYRLRLDFGGGAFEAAPADAQPILYGSTITGRIDDETPQALFAFFGQQGDAITVALNRGDGNLDPVVSILGENLQPLITDDDSGGNQNARIDRYVLSRTGVYYIRAGRYSGPEGSTDTRGSFILVLAQLNE